MDYMTYTELKGIHEALLQLIDAVALVADRIRPDMEKGGKKKKRNSAAFSDRALKAAYKANGHG